MKKAVNTIVILLLLLIPGLILYRAISQYRSSGGSQSYPNPDAKFIFEHSVKNGGGKPIKQPKDGADPAQKAVKIKKQPVAPADLPALVKATLEKQMPDLNFDKLELENQKGQEIYSAKWGPKGSECELKLTADGAVIESKAVVPFDSMSADARAALANAQPTAQNFECKKLTTYENGEATVTYEVRGQADGEKLPPLRVTSEGTLVEGKGGKGK